MLSTRIGPGRLLTAIGAILVLVSLPLTWYHAERAVHSELTGWSIFTNLRIVLAAAAVLALLTVVLDRGRLVFVARAALGLIAGAPVLRRIISPPDSSVALDNRIGLYVALVGAVAIIAGGLLSLGRRAAEAMGWDVPDPFATRLALPAPRPPADDGAARPLEPVVDADVVEDRETART